MSVLNHPLISARYFFPRGRAVANPTWVDVEDARLACFASDNGHPVTVVFFHGNGEVVADYVPEWAQMFDDLGADCFFAEYRGYGASTGTPALGKLLDDVDAIFEATGRPAEELIVFGRSVGSIPAIEMAHRYPDVAGLVLESAIADPLERILMRASPEELATPLAVLQTAFRKRLDHLAKLRSRKKPTLLMHTRDDSLVDASHAARLSSCPAENVRLVMFPHGDHNTIFAVNRDEYIAELRHLVSACASGTGQYDKPANAPASGPIEDVAYASLSVWAGGPEPARSNIEARPVGKGVRIDASVSGAGYRWSHGEVVARDVWSELVERVVDAIAAPPTRYAETARPHAGRVSVSIGGVPAQAYDELGGKDDHARRVAVAVMRIVARLGGPTASALLPLEPSAANLRSPDATLELGVFDPDATTEFDAPRLGLPDLLPATREMSVPEELLAFSRDRNGPGETAELDQQQRDPEPDSDN